MTVPWPVAVPQPPRRSLVPPGLTFPEAVTAGRRLRGGFTREAAAAAAASSVESDSVPGLSLSSGGSDEAGDGGVAAPAAVPVVSTESLPLRWSPKAAEEGLQLQGSHTPLTGRLGIARVRSWPAHWSLASRAHSHCCLSCAALCLHAAKDEHTCPRHRAYRFLPGGVAGVLRGSLVPRLFLESREHRHRGQVRAAAATAAGPAGAPPSTQPSSSAHSSSAAASGGVDCTVGQWEDACLASFDAAVGPLPRAGKRGGAGTSSSPAKKMRWTPDR